MKDYGMMINIPFLNLKDDAMYKKIINLENTFTQNNNVKCVDENSC